MVTITKNTDGDTFRIDDESTRVLGINTAESVAVNESRNTQAGQDASDKAKVIAPTGTEVRTEPTGKDVFGTRTLADVKIQTAGGEVDYGLVALDQGMSKYETDHGTHPNPEQHDIFKEFYSENAPYQYADVREPMATEDYNRVASNIAAYTEAEQAYEAGDISREDYEAAMHSAYGNGKEVAQYRYQNNQWQRKFDMEKFDGSDRAAYDWAHQSQENRDKYDKAVRNSHTGFRTNPEQSLGFWKELWVGTKTMFSSLNDFAVIGRAVDYTNARQYSDGEFDVSDEELVKGVPDQWRDKVMQESEKYGDDVALQYRDNLLVALENEEVMSELPLATQIVTAIPAILASPLTLVGGLKVAQGTVALGRTIDATLAVGKLKHLAIPAKVSTWAAAGSAEAGISALPRLTAEETFTSKDMLNEMKYGALFGVAAPIVLKGVTAGVSRISKHSTEMKRVSDNIQKETAAWVEQPKPTPAPQVEMPDVSRSTLRERATVAVDNVLAAVRPSTYKRGKASATVDAATGGLTKSFTQTMLESKSKVSNWIGNNLLELPEGLGGKALRGHSAALEQNSRRTRYLTQTQPDYHKLMGQYAGEQGKRGLGKFMSQHMDGQSNVIAKRFSRDVVTTIEQRRQGRTVQSQSPSVLKMVDTLESSMTKMYDDLVDAGVEGFKSERRIKNYFPQLWNDTGIQRTVKQYGRPRVQQLLAKGYVSSKHNDIDSMVEALHIADNFLKNQAKGDVADGALPATIDSRAQERLDVDSTVSDGDLSLLDLLDTDFSTVTAKYANRAAGKVALANKGIKSDFDQEALRNKMKAEGADAKELQLFDDTFDVIMGRPTRGGLPEAVREMKDAVALSKMGGLGMAQAAEAGTVIARSLLQLTSDPKTFKKIWAMAGESTDNVALMRETQALSGITNEVHLLDRQAVHLDQSQVGKIGGARDVANWVAGKASFGKWKAPAGYILSQASGFNMIRRFERRLANASFMLDTAKTFKNGTGKMSRERMLDIGLDPDDVGLKRIFNDVVEYDEHGIVKKLNIEQWDKPTLEKYQLAMYRDDAQMVQQTIGGEMPAWINNPAMTVIAQFKQQAILANKKQLTRQLQFADQEAVLGTMMNTMLAGLTRTAKFGTLGAAAYAVTGNEAELQKPWEKDYWQPEKYVSTFGFFPDMIHIGLDSAEAIQEERVDMKTAGDGIAGEIPMLGWMKDYYDLGTADSLSEKADAAKGVAILGNMQFADIIYKGLEAQLDD
tara:strand:- start:2302 stop:6024 length:3723 start_codon:yes stop_codon:yes gene_type:complete